MKDSNKAKGLGNLQTATTKRLRARPPERGTSHLDMYLISMGKRRLEAELAHLEERRRRVRERLNGNQEELTRLQQVARAEEADENSDYNGAKTREIPAQPPPGPAQRPWTTMPLEY